MWRYLAGSPLRFDDVGHPANDAGLDPIFWAVVVKAGTTNDQVNTPSQLTPPKLKKQKMVL
jgi:hypothetical protein